MMSFPVSMPCDDVGVLLKQNNTLEKDVETFGGTPVLISCPLKYRYAITVLIYCMYICITFNVLN